MIKPPYKVPSMAEIQAIPWNGFNVVSTFSGGGGSCLGYRMAGYRVLWANEFIPAAQETYKANHPNSILDKRDIRLIKPQDILDATGLKIGEIDIFDGSPPCAAFSTAGKREKGWGKIKDYSDSKQRVDDLFFEYARLIKGTQPKVFVAENVAGLVKGKVKGYFLEILKSLKDCGYNVKCRLLNSKWLGVPQTRQRVIFIGVRKDISIEPVYPLPFNYFYSLRDAIKDGDMTGYCSYMKDGTMTNECYKNTMPGSNGLSKYAKEKFNKNTLFDSHRLSFDLPCKTLIHAPVVYHPEISRTLTISEAKRVCSFPDDFIITGSYRTQWERLGRAVPPVMMSHIAKTIQLEILEKL